jgi:hypothetical protein
MHAQGAHAGQLRVDRNPHLRGRPSSARTVTALLT